MWMMIQKNPRGVSRVPSVYFIRYGLVRRALRRGLLEYRVFGWVYIRGKKRKTFMTMQDNLGYAGWPMTRPTFPYSRTSFNSTKIP